MLAIPAAFSPQELWETKLQGALAVKLFPAQLHSPATLKDMLNIGLLGSLNIIPSGAMPIARLHAIRRL